MSRKPNFDVNVDGRTNGRTNGRTEIWTPISHPAISRCDKKWGIRGYTLYGHVFLMTKLFDSHVSKTVEICLQEVYFTTGLKACNKTKVHYEIKSFEQLFYDRHTTHHHYENWLMQYTL